MHAEQFWGNDLQNGSPYAIGQLSCLSLCLSVTLVYCGQTVGQIKMKLGTQVGLGHGHIVLDGDPAPPPQKGAEPPNLRPISAVAKWLNGSRCHFIKGGPQAKRHCVRWGPSSPPTKEGEAPNFQPMSIVAKWLNGSRCQLVGR